MSYLGRVGVVIEVAPNRFISYRLRGSEVTVELERERGDVTSWGLTERPSFGPTRVRMELEGYLDSHEEAARPTWAEEPQGEIEATRQLPAGPTRELPAAEMGA